ncbi:MAG: hypothetical protein HDT30_01785 [Clostridiales bacterium]|nr:hypothetical protein [Clostridiales bacterium]
MQWKNNGYCSLTSLTLAVKLCAKKIEQPRIQPFAEGELLIGWIPLQLAP